ncbi:flagellar assembly protein FliH [Novosphingobium sp. CF614]|uniref:FliH/SctL family protein n=1 Tax=Novosphingobium sp. CF614 TaxID=1884364 RepID=UPI0008E9CE40|nr:FliH/SctL family protein [Novosphingobium sp. CF614]SFF76109.1 flagellar assembly protein FliH [Novosphingobium sp. CF614]
MSNLGFPVPRPGFNLLEVLGQAGGFTPDTRFGGTLPIPEPAPRPEPVAIEEEAPDPVAEAFAAGFAAGHEQARGEAEARAAADAAAREGLMLSFHRFDNALEEELRLRLRDTVAALCEASIAPLALDEEALLRRIARAVSMLARADDERVIRLHPEDLGLVSPRLSAEWQVQPDPKLERGTIRIESANGGVEDGPATWRLAIAEALQQC